MLVLSAAPRADLDAGPRASALLSVTPRDRTMLPVDPLRAPRPTPWVFPKALRQKRRGRRRSEKRPRFSRQAEVGRAPTRGPKKTRGRAGSPTRAARAFSFFWLAAPPYPKGGVYGGLAVSDRVCP